MANEEILKLVKELQLKIQTLEDRITKLEIGDFGSGIYLDGCTEAAKDYISSKEKEGA